MLSGLFSGQDSRASLGSLGTRNAGFIGSPQGGVSSALRRASAAHAEPYFAGEGSGSPAASPARVGRTGRFSCVSAVAVYLWRRRLYAGPAVSEETPAHGGSASPDAGDLSGLRDRRTETSLLRSCGSIRVPIASRKLRPDFAGGAWRGA